MSGQPGDQTIHHLGIEFIPKVGDLISLKARVLDTVDFQIG